ncbi:MAG: sugar transferase [Kouleothrix sp.]|nr:sugar transferase [Kouleothrix sp.]
MVQDFTTTNRSRTSGPWYLAIDPQHRLIRGKAYHFVKRAIDIAFCLMIAPFVGPVLLLVALLVYLDSPGRVLFTQLRTGKGGRRFKMYKFRSMVPNAEELKIKYAHLNELTWPDFKITNDPRITRVGKILRKTSLDELPQLLNVLKGDMSLVGPRPTSFAPETYRLWHTERLEVVPGITGLWQISGRSNLDFDQRLKLDIAYIERQSIWMDVCIVVRTVAQVFVGEGAY